MLEQARDASPVSLLREHGDHPRAPGFLDRREYFELVIDDPIAIAGYRHSTSSSSCFSECRPEHCPPQPRRDQIARSSLLEHHIPIRRDDRLSSLLYLLHRIERVREPSIHKWIAHRKVRDRQDLWIAVMFNPITSTRRSVLSWAHPLACIISVDQHALRMFCVRRAEGATRHTHQESPQLVPLHRQLRISGRSSPCSEMYCLCSMSFSPRICLA
jgi:hypothetical protein